MRRNITAILCIYCISNFNKLPPDAANVPACFMQEATNPEQIQTPSSVKPTRTVAEGPPQSVRSNLEPPSRPGD